jgi:hypothetical protein
MGQFLQEVVAAGEPLVAGVFAEIPLANRFDDGSVVFSALYYVRFVAGGVAGVCYGGDAFGALAPRASEVAESVCPVFYEW